MADFFERVREGVTKGVATVSTGSKTLLEKTKINSVIKNLNDEKKQLLEVLGNKVFMYATTEKKDIPLADVEPICAQIIQRDAQIEEQKAKIVELDMEMSKITGAPVVTGETCSCGAAIKVGSKFCTGCGKKLM